MNNSSSRPTWGLLGRRRPPDLPAAGGRGGDAADPARARSSCTRSSPWSPRWRPPASASGSWPTSTTTSPARCSSSVDKPWIPVIHSRYIVGVDGISLPLLAPDAADRAAVHHLLVEPHPRAAGTRRRSSSSSSILETGMIGSFVAAGPHPLLRLLRGRAAADVLHDRRVGRRAAPVRVDQVLPVHAVRLGADDRLLPGAVLPVDRCASTAVTMPHVRHGPAAAGGQGHRARHAVCDLRRHVHRLRHQGADVPVPHVAARRPHPGPDAWAR